MQLQSLKLVTIVTEDVLRQQLVTKFLECGATGYTVQHAYGFGSRGARADAVAPNLEFQVICSQEVAEAILTYVSHHFFANYACIAWLTDVQVVKGQHYVK
jgi:nitrogen regulatory protein P-II 2